MCHHNQMWPTATPESEGFWMDEFHGTRTWFSCLTVRGVTECLKVNLGLWCFLEPLQCSRFTLFYPRWQFKVKQNAGNVVFCNFRSYFLKLQRFALWSNTAIRHSSERLGCHEVTFFIQTFCKIFQHIYYVAYIALKYYSCTQSWSEMYPQMPAISTKTKPNSGTGLNLLLFLSKYNCVTGL